MKRSNNGSIFKRRFLRINVSLGKVIKQFGSSDIRLFRVEVKKLRALLRLIKTENEVKELALPKKLHKFYKEVGAIRTFRLQQKLVRYSVLKINPDIRPKAYLNLLTTKIKHSISYARSIAKDKDPFKRGKQQLEKQIPRKLGIATMREFTWEEVNSLKNLLGSVFTSDASLHAIRKIFKDLLYTWPYIQKEARVILPSAIFCSREDLDFIAKRLGKFQDTCTSIDLLREYNSSQENDRNEQLFLTAMEKMWLTEKDILRSEIHNLFHKRIPARQSFTFLADGHHAAIENKLLTR